MVISGHNSWVKSAVCTAATATQRVAGHLVDLHDRIQPMRCQHALHPLDPGIADAGVGQRQRAVRHHLRLALEGLEHAEGLRDHSLQCRDETVTVGRLGRGQQAQVANRVLQVVALFPRDLACQGGDVLVAVNPSGPPVALR